MGLTSPGQSTRRNPVRTTPRQRLYRSDSLLSKHSFQGDITLVRLPAYQPEYPVTPPLSRQGSLHDMTQVDQFPAHPSEYHPNTRYNSEFGDSSVMLTPPSSPEVPKGRKQSKRDSPSHRQTSDSHYVPEPDDHDFGDDIQVLTSSIGRAGQLEWHDQHHRLTDAEGNIIQCEPIWAEPSYDRRLEFGSQYHRKVVTDDMPSLDDHEDQFHFHRGYNTGDKEDDRPIARQSSPLRLLRRDYSSGRVARQSMHPSSHGHLGDSRHPYYTDDDDYSAKEATDSTRHYGETSGREPARSVRAIASRPNQLYHQDVSPGQLVSSLCSRASALPRQDRYRDTQAHNRSPEESKQEIVRSKRRGNASGEVRGMTRDRSLSRLERDPQRHRSRSRSISTDSSSQDSCRSRSRDRRDSVESVTPRRSSSPDVTLILIAKPKPKTNLSKSGYSKGGRSRAGFDQDLLNRQTYAPGTLVAKQNERTLLSQLRELVKDLEETRSSQRGAKITILGDMGR